MQCDILDIGLSDHRLIRWIINTTRDSPCYETVSSRSWKELPHDEFCSPIFNSSLYDAQFTSQLSVVELATLYDVTVTEILDSLIPVKQSTIIKRNSDQWFNDECRLEKRSCRKLESIYSRTQLATDRDEWKTQLRKYQQTLTKTKSTFWKARLQRESSTPRKLWQSLSALQGKQSKSANGSL